MKKLIVCLVLSMAITSSIFVIAASTRFSDVGSHWAKDYISCLTENGAIKGYTDGTFKPENKISRAEFTAILLRALRNDVDQPKDGKWYDNYIKEATNRKYILAGEFDNVEKDITRGEIARMIVRALTETYPANFADYASQLADYSKTPEAYKDFTLKAYVKGIITGRPGGIFAHADPATRAEATTMIVRLTDTGKRVVPKEPVSNDVYIKDAATGVDTKVTTSHPELLPHIKKGIEIMSADAYLHMLYSLESNHVKFTLYANKEEREKPIWEQKAIMSYSVYTEHDPRSDDYLPFSIVLYDTQNPIGYRMCKELIKDVFPEAYDKAIKELDKKAKDSSYSTRIWEKVNGREIRIFLFEGSNQFNMFVAPEK